MKYQSIVKRPFFIVLFILLIGLGFVLAPKHSHASEPAHKAKAHHATKLSPQMLAKLQQKNVMLAKKAGKAAYMMAWGSNDQGQLGMLRGAAVPQTVVLNSQGQPLFNAKQLVIGDNFACVLTLNATVECWGSNEYGQLGDGTTMPHYYPKLVSGAGDAPVLQNVLSISGSNHYMCAVLKYSSAMPHSNVVCWGQNDNYQLGQGGTFIGPAVSSEPSPVNVETDAGSVIGDTLYISTSTTHVCGLSQLSKAISCWGVNFNAQMGPGLITKPYGFPVKTQLPLPIPPTPYIPLATGDSFTCGIDGNFTMQCVGLMHASVSNVNMISAGGHQLCDLAQGQGVTCRTLDNQSGVLIPNTQSAMAISTSDNHVCALMADGTVQCWGNNDFGQLGNGTSINSTTPVTVKNLTGLQVRSLAISPRGNNSGVVLKDGTVRIWGSNAGGQLGNGTQDDQIISTPSVVQQADQAQSPLTNIVQASVGANFSCAVVTGPNNTTPVMCWGDNTNGTLGDGSYNNSAAPVQVKNIQHALSVSVGDEHACALIKADDGSTPIVCWGDNTLGQLGNNQASNTNKNSNIPVTVTPTDGQDNFTQVTVANEYTCALAAPKGGQGSAYCWGGNAAGQLGNNDLTVKQLNVPTPVVGGHTFTQISAGRGHVCAIANAASQNKSNAYCWGYNNYIQLGSTQQPTGPIAKPVNVSGADHYAAISSGSLYTCGLVAVDGDGTNVKCWGVNNSGQIGVADSDASKQYTPTFIHDDTKAIALATYDHHACILSADSTVKCWGDNKYGQLAQDPGATPFADEPTVVNNLPKYVTSLATGGGSASTMVIVGDKPPTPPAPTNPESISWADSANAIVAPNGVSSDNAIHGATLDASATLTNPQPGDVLTYACSIHTPAPAHAAVANTTCIIPKAGAVRPITIVGTGLNPANGYAIYVSATVTRDGATVPDAQVHWIRLYKEIPAATASESINWPTADADISVPSTYSGTSLTGSLTANAILLKPQDGDQLVYSCGVYDGSMKPVAGTACGVSTSGNTSHAVSVTGLPSTATSLTIHFSATVSRDGKTVPSATIPWVKVDKNTQLGS